MLQPHHRDAAQLWRPAVVAIGAVLWLAAASGAAAADAAPVDTAPALAEHRWIAVPRIAARLTAADIGLVVNTADPYSVAVAAYYRERRGLAADQVLEVELPVRPQISPDELHALRDRIAERFGDGVQALALAWVMPYAVRCHSLVGALALGFDAELCRHTCGASRPSPYFASASARPWSELGLRPAMHLAAVSVEQARALIDRGVAADGRLGRRGAPPATALLLTTADRARNVRAALYPPSGTVPALGLDVVEVGADALDDAAFTPRAAVLVQLGAAQLPQVDRLRFVAGALADHVTSAGGKLDGRGAQMNALAWIAAGATASHGTVSEPCNHLQKFPHPQVLLLNYAQGASAVEAYWRSVAWPQQSTFVGDPLAAPFALLPR